MALLIVFCLFAIALAQNDPNCGTKGPTASSFRIVGGTNANFLEFPWQISLRINDTSGLFIHYCGGSIIRDQWILTTAHCIPSLDPTMYSIRVGEHDTAKYEGTEFDSSVSKVFIHEWYNSSTSNNDMAVLKLTQPLNMTGSQNHLGTICVGSKKSDITGKSCISTGWGNTQWEGDSPAILQKVTVQVMNQTICKDKYKGINMVTDGMICAGRAGKGTCQGDSGGPLQCRIGNKWTQYGATSWAFRCAKALYPSVYARVNYYYDWIWNKVNNN